MEINSVSQLLALVLTVLEWLIAFVKAILLPVIPAAIIISFVVDHVFKRLPFWKDGWAGYASFALNLLFSAGLFFSSQAGKSEEYLEVIVGLGTLLTLIVSVGLGFAVTNKTHSVALKAGVGKSTTDEEIAKEDAEWLATVNTAAAGAAAGAVAGAGEVVAEAVASDEEELTRDGPLTE